MCWSLVTSDYIFFVLLIIHGMEGIIWEKAPLLSGIQSSFITDLLKTSITNDPERPETFGEGCDMLYGKKKNTDLPKMRNTFCRLARRLIKEDRVEGGWSMVGPDKGRGVCLPETPSHKSHTKWNLCVEEKGSRINRAPNKRYHPDEKSHSDKRISSKWKISFR